MPTMCKSCCKDAPEDELIACGQPQCNNKYHYQCVGLETPSSEARASKKRAQEKSWCCPKCLPKRRNNKDDTPVKNMSPACGSKPAALVQSDMSGISGKPVKAKSSDDNTFSSTARTEILCAIRTELPEIIRSQINSEFQLLRQDFQALEDALKFTNTMYEDMKKVTEQQSKQLKELRSENANLLQHVKDIDSRITSLERDSAKQQQWSRLQNVEIVGVPEVKNESTVDIVTKIAETVGMNLSAGEIEYAHRVQPMRAIAGRPRAIVARFKNRLTKDTLVSSARKRHGLTSGDIGVGGESKKFYVNEHLTPANKKLLNECKIKAKENSIKFVWTKNCRIFTRKDELSPPIPISTEHELKTRLS